MAQLTVSPTDIKPLDDAQLADMLWSIVEGSARQAAEPFGSDAFVTAHQKMQREIDWASDHSYMIGHLAIVLVRALVAHDAVRVLVSDGEQLQTVIIEMAQLAAVALTLQHGYRIGGFVFPSDEQIENADREVGVDIDDVFIPHVIEAEHRDGEWGVA